ncbi:MAG: MlaD family protein [Verrucomicrobiae bacterium]|nr:MlaD family protein [Verrucomicrobiae bacterium]
MSASSNHFKIGVFVLLAFGLFFCGLVAFGLMNLFVPSTRFETYVDSSIEGLSIGSPVKFRGVKVGKVTRIEFADKRYAAGGSGLVLITFDVEEEYAPFSDDLENEVQKEIDKGLRARVTSQGITGTSYLSLDYLNPKDHAPMPITWKPHHFYIPSAKSQLSQMISSLEKSLRKIENLPLDKIGTNLDELLIEVRYSNIKAQSFMDTLNESNLRESIENLGTITENLDSISQDLRTYPSHFFLGPPPAPSKSLPPAKK